MRTTPFLFVFLSSFCLASQHMDIVDVDFADSMKVTEYPKEKEDALSKLMFNFFQNHYQEMRPSCVAVHDECKIPKLFHYIWFGTKLPQTYRPYLQSWLDQHPDWTFCVWVDNPENYELGTLVEHADFFDVEQLLADENAKGKIFVFDVKSLTFNNKKHFDASRNYGERSDILRWELLYRFGGTYIDVDFECFKPFDVLHHMYDFYTGLQPMDTNTVQFGSGLVGCIPGHPILRRCVETISADATLPIVTRTGPVHFMYAFFQEYSVDGLCNAVFPAGYFYPRGFKQPKEPRECWICPESFATHHWAGSWLKEEGWYKP